MTINEMISYVQAYIKLRKGVEVNIKIETSLDVFKLRRAFEYARDWTEGQKA